MFDLNKSFSILLSDLKHRVFVKSPFELELIRLDVPGWLRGIEEEMQNAYYQPQPVFVADIPKGNGAVRPGPLLSIRDHIAYTAYVDAGYGQIHSQLAWAQGTIDFAYQLHSSPDSAGWFKGSFTGWNDFRQFSLNAIDQGAAYLVTADIAGFYENVDHAMLMSQLRETGFPNEAIDGIRKYLVTWSPLGTKGIPQGLSASDLLAKLYLNTVDHELADRGFIHYRYVDDYRIFCSNLPEAKRALIALTQMMRALGLNLQSSKTHISRADAMRPEIEGAAKIIATVQNELIEARLEYSESEYTTWSPDEEAAEYEVPLEVLEQAFQNYFIDSSPAEFNKSLFHFLLNRLAEANSIFAVDYCLRQLEHHPEETSASLDYILGVNAVDSSIPELLPFLNSEAAVYHYQNFQIMEWFLRLNHIPDEVVSLARSVAFDASKPAFLRGICRCILRSFGTSTDLHRLAAQYGPTVTTYEQCEIIYCITRMERGRRNAFLSKVESTSELHRRATKHTRQAI